VHSDCFFVGCRTADALDPKLLLVEKYVGSYSTLAGAQRALRRRKCKSLAELFARHLTPCAPAQAQLGDLVIINMGDGDHVGAQFITKTVSGPSFHGLSECTAAFRT